MRYNTYILYMYTILLNRIDRIFILSTLFRLYTHCEYCISLY